MKRRKQKKNFIKSAAVLIASVFLLAAAAASVTVAYLLKDLPDPQKISDRKVIESTKIYDRTGQILLYEIHGEEKRTVVPLDKISAFVKNATIATEDADFYKHKGINIRGIIRALVVDILSGNITQGGSSITQQLVKKSFLKDERTLTRKVREFFLAVRIENKYSKDEILELYLNQIPYGSNAYGIEAASLTFFGKESSKLSLAESAVLSALPKAPSHYSPYGSHKEDLLKRKDFVLRRMTELGHITEEEAQKALTEKISFLPPTKSIRAPHFVMMVKDYLNEKYGEGEVESGGFKVITTLNYKLQEIAESAIKEGAKRNEKLIKAKNAALVAVDPKTGEIIALVGSRDYFDVKNEGNFNVATALRQPGSAFKPFVYATAFGKGYAPETVLFDVPTEFNPDCGAGATSTVAKDRQLRPGEEPAEYEKCYHPGNYDEKFRGPVNLRKAIAQSINIPSVKLLYLAGIGDSIKTAQTMGITSLTDPKRYGLSLVLGGAEVKLVEITSAYGIFANDGIMNPITTILKIEKNGKILEEKKSEPKQVIDADIARIMNDVLSDNEARIGVFQRNSSLYFPDRQVAAKTGTTQEYRDAWTIGYTHSLVAGVWVGNNDNTPIQQKGSGVLAAAPIWRSFMASATAKTEPEEFTKPEHKKPEKPILRGIWAGGQTVLIDKISKKLASTSTPPDFIEETAYGTPHSILYWVKKTDPTGPKPENPEEDHQYKNWEWSFQEWLKTSGLEEVSTSSIPTEYDDVHTEDNRPKISVISFQEDEKSYTLIFKVSSKFPIKSVDLIINGELLKNFPSVANDQDLMVEIQKEIYSQDVNKTEIKAYDKIGNWNGLILENGTQIPSLLPPA